MDNRNIAEIDNGGQAFPIPGFDGPDNGQDAVEGMALRDWFAGKALQGLLSDAWMKSDNSSIQSFADEAYNWADAMIQARKGGAA